MASREFEPYAALFRPVIKGMQALLGDRSEFVLHDLSRPEESLVAVEGSITGRQPGAPVTNIVIEAIKKHGDDAPDMIGYSSVSKDGRPLKSSTVFIRNPEGHIVGCMCSNLDITEFQIAQSLLESLSGCGYIPGQAEEKHAEVFAQDIREMVEGLVMKEIAASPRPVPLMGRQEKLQLIRALEQKGIFEVKGSVELAAHCLGVSSFTVYSYLKEIRSGNKGQ